MKEFFYQKASFFQYFRIINNVLIKKYKIIIFLSLIINCLSDNFAQNVDCVTATTICDDPNPTGNPTGISNINSQAPDRFSLSQNYPNPFNPVTNIEFSVPHSGLVNIAVYDALGREIETLVNDDLNPGTYNAAWDASGYNSGVYFYRFTSASFTETKKMILVK